MRRRTTPRVTAAGGRRTVKKILPILYHLFPKTFSLLFSFKYYFKIIITIIRPRKRERRKRQKERKRERKKSNQLTWKELMWYELLLLRNRRRRRRRRKRERKNISYYYLLLQSLSYFILFFLYISKWWSPRPTLVLKNRKNTTRPTIKKKRETRLVAVTSPVARSQGQNQRERDEYYK